jgi:hypothetical protein
VIRRLGAWWRWRKHPEAREWKAWALGKARCPYCIDIEDDDEWIAVCDCWMAERELLDGKEEG